MSAPEREKFMSNIEIDTSRLTSLVSQYSELAKAESLIVDPSTKTNVKELLTDIVGRYDPSQVTIQIEDTAADIFVRMSEDHFDLVVSSLIDNARKHRGSTVAVEIQAQTHPVDRSFMEMLITNEGPSIPDDVASYIFEPGYTTSKESGSDGLGLTIVKAHLRAHSGDITLLPTDERVTFQVTIPLMSV